MTSQPSISIVISYRQRKPNNINGNRKKIFRFIVAFITLVLDISEKGWHSPICLFFCCCLFVCFFPFKDICKNIKNDDDDNNNNNNNNNSNNNSNGDDDDDDDDDKKDDKKDGDNDNDNDNDTNKSNSNNNAADDNNDNDNVNMHVSI